MAVTYEASNFRQLYFPTVSNPTFYGATLPENTYAFTVVVNDSGSAPEFDTGLVINVGKSTT